MLRSRFEAIPSAFSERLVPSSDMNSKGKNLVLLVSKSFRYSFDYKIQVVQHIIPFILISEVHTKLEK